MAGMSRYACCWVPRFAVAALVRNDPRLHGQPVAAVTGTSATRCVHEVSTEAWRHGVRPGMSTSEATTHAPRLVCREQDLAAERAASGALRDAALTVSPRLEVVAPDQVHLDLTGLGLLADEPGIGRRLLDVVAGLDLPVRIGIADTRTAAALVARAASGVVIVPSGQTERALAPLPVVLLAPAPDLRESLERWGIRTLGELAALPTAAVLGRLGGPGVRLQRLARGEDDRPFVAHTPAEPCVETLTLDWEIVSLAALAFVLRRLLDRLTARLAGRDLGAMALVLTLGLADGGSQARRLGLIAPLREPRTLLALLLADLEELALAAPVVALTLEAEPAPLGGLQADLFAPTRPSPRELAEILGRLAALVGPDRVGTPTLGDTYRPDAIGVGPFQPPGGGASAAPPPCPLPTGAFIGCRRVVPPLPAVVTRKLPEDGPPRHVAAAGVRGAVVAWAGPWRTAGEWWADTAWAREEWDVALPDGAVYRLVRDRATGAWSIEAIYD